MAPFRTCRSHSSHLEACKEGAAQHGTMALKAWLSTSTQQQCRCGAGLCVMVQMLPPLWHWPRPCLVLWPASYSGTVE